MFDAATDVGVASELPREAYRRFSSDAATRSARGLQLQAEQSAIWEGKKRAVAEWVEAHGTPDQQARHAAGVLPVPEVVNAMAG